MKTYKIPIRWESYKRVTVEAENLQSAIYLALKQFLSEPDELYLEDSFEIDSIIKEDYPEEEYNLQEIYDNFMKSIYLISTDGSIESIILDFYAVSIEDIQKIIYWYRKEYLYEEVDILSIEVDFDKLEVKFESKPDWDDEWEEHTYYLHKIYKV